MAGKMSPWTTGLLVLIVILMIWAMFFQESKFIRDLKHGAADPVLTQLQSSGDAIKTNLQGSGGKIMSYLKTPPAPPS